MTRSALDVVTLILGQLTKFSGVEINLEIISNKFNKKNLVS